MMDRGVKASLLAATDEIQAQVMAQVNQLNRDIKNGESQAQIIKDKIRELESPKKDAKNHLAAVHQLQNKMRFEVTDDERVKLRHDLRYKIQQLVDEIIFFPRETGRKRFVFTGADIVLEDFVPELEFGNASYLHDKGDFAGARKELEKARKAVVEYRASNSGRQHGKILICLKGGYKHVLAWDAKNREFIQETAYTREHGYTIGGKALTELMGAPSEEMKPLHDALANYFHETKGQGFINRVDDSKTTLQ